MATEQPESFYKEISKLIKMPPHCTYFKIECAVNSLVTVTTQSFAENGNGEQVTKVYDLVERTDEAQSEVR